MKFDSISILLTTAVCLYSLLSSTKSHACGYKLSKDCEPKCNRNAECADDEMCIENNCVDVCKYKRPCGFNTTCLAINHIPFCNCLPGLEGNPYYKGCKRSNGYPCCHSNSNCPDYEMCHQKKCISACDRNPPCGDNTNCFTAKHKRICECLPGLKGDPYNGGCKKINPGLYCDNNTECADDQICDGEKCVNACGVKSLCGPNTTCIAKNHFSICECSPGFTGDPYGRGCTRLVHGCWNNPDCADNEVCDGGKCILGCDEQPSCGHSTSCSTIDHIRECVCLPGYEGDAYGNGCDKRTADPCCENDADCADDETCLENKCVYSCDHGLSCGYNATCLATNHISICECLPGLIGDPYGDGCKSANIYPCCRFDHECADDETCDGKKCVNACDYHGLLCGPNAFCTSKNHDSFCQCLDGFSNDANGFGCSESTHDCCSNTDCEYNEICIGGKCVIGCDQQLCI